MNDAFERNQLNPELPDVKIIWAGHSVLVFLPASPELREPDVVFSANKSNTVDKIQAWCVVNDARCSQIKEGRVWL